MRAAATTTHTASAAPHTSCLAHAVKRKFEDHRRAHYNTGGLAALRAKAASLDADEEEDDEDEDSDDDDKGDEEGPDQRRARSASNGA